MSQQVRYLSSTNGYLPAESAQVIAFIRRPEKFKLNSYVQFIPSPKQVGLYALLGFDEAVRNVSDAERAWEDGDEAPKGEYNKVPFSLQPYRCYRRAEPWTIGNEAIEPTTFFKPKVVHMNYAISKMMVNRTQRIITLMENTANWGQNYGSASQLNGGAGAWPTASDDPASSKYNAISNTFLEAARRINLFTNSVIGIEDLRCVISPGLAIAMSQSPEIRNYIRQSPAAMDVEEGRKNSNQLWSQIGRATSELQSHSFISYA